MREDLWTMVTQEPVARWSKEAFGSLREISGMDGDEFPMGAAESLLDSIRRGDWLVKPEAETLDGREVDVRAGWPLDEDETRGGIYRGEWAMLLPDGLPLTWIASGDLRTQESSTRQGKP